MPTVNDTPKATNTDTEDTIVVIPANRSMPIDRPTPTRIPTTPPATLISTASLRN